MSLFMILTAPFANLNILSNPAIAQGYDNYNYNTYYGDNDMYSKYPTEVNKYECRTGPFEGFFVSSVEFCKVKFDKDDQNDKDIRTGTQGPPGIQGPQGQPGANGTNGVNGTNGINGTNGVNGTEIDPCVACLLDALVKLDSGSVLVNVTAEIEFSGDRVEDITLPLVIDVDLALLLQQQLANATGLDPGATIFEICAAIDEQGLDIQAVLTGLEVTLVPIVEEQISKLVLTIVVAINDLLGTSIVLTPEEVIDAVDIDDIVVQITANVQVSLGILETCLDLTPIPPPPPPPVPISKVCTVWQDDTTGNDEIFFSGSRDDGETFSTPLNISRNTGDSKEPQLRCDGNNVYVVWEGDTTTSADNDIFFSFSHDGGQTFSTKNISNDTANSEETQISSQGNNVYVVWQNGTQNILFVRSTDGGQTLSEPDNVSNNTGGVEDPQISSEGNNVYVIWREFLSFPNLFDIFISRSTDGGQTFSEADNIGNNTDNAFNPQISSQGNNAYVVWQNDITTSDTPDIFFSFSQNGGQTFSDPFNISNSIGDSENPQISSEVNNTYVVWQEDTDPPFGNRDIFFARSTDGGQTFNTKNLSNNTADSVTPQISSQGNNVYVVWQEDGEIFFSFSHDGGQTFSTPPDNISNNTGNSLGPQISSKGNNTYVVWEDDTDNDFFNFDIFFSFSHDGGQTFSTPPDNLSNNIGRSQNPQISSDTETQQQSTNEIITTAGNNNHDHTINDNTINDITSINSIIEQEEKQKLAEEQKIQQSNVMYPPLLPRIQ